MDFFLYDITRSSSKPCPPPQVISHLRILSLSKNNPFRQELLSQALEITQSSSGFSAGPIYGLHIKQISGVSHPGPRLQEPISAPWSILWSNKFWERWPIRKQQQPLLCCHSDSQDCSFFLSISRVGFRPSPLGLQLQDTAQALSGPVEARWDKVGIYIPYSLGPAVALSTLTAPTKEVLFESLNNGIFWPLMLSESPRVMEPFFLWNPLCRFFWVLSHSVATW